MDTSMIDIDSKPNCELLQRIYSEIRDFRKEYNERSIYPELTIPRQLAVQTGNENGQTNSNNSVPQMSFQEPKLPPCLVPQQMPGQCPSPVAAEQIASDVDLEARMHLSDVDVATKNLKDKIEEKKQLWEDARMKNVELNKQVAEQQAKVTRLQQIIARAGRSDNAAIDSDVSMQFLQLRSDILQIVKNHFVYDPLKTRHPRASPDLEELILRKELASALYKKFFSAEAMPFGFGDESSQNPMKIFEMRLRERRCDESVIKEWRIATVKAGKLLDGNLPRYARKISDQIWMESLSKYCPHYKGSKQDAARLDLDSVCEKAANIAISFRGSVIEYEWEQDESSLPQSRAVVTKDHEIIGTKGPNPNEETNFAISFIVFGGVVRGDKGTGLLENGRIRLGKSQVVIKYTN